VEQEGEFGRIKGVRFGKTRGLGLEEQESEFGRTRELVWKNKRVGLEEQKGG